MLLRNPVHLRLRKLQGWQHVTFMACLCERMYPNFVLFAQHSEQHAAPRYRQILDLVWESLIVKNAKINFDNQLEKLTEIIPEADEAAVYAVWPAIDACAALSELLHALLSGDTLEQAVKVSQISVHTVAMLETAQCEQEMDEAALQNCEAVTQEWDIQWEIYRLLLAHTDQDSAFLKDLRADLQEAAISNIGVALADVRNQSTENKANG